MALDAEGYGYGSHEEGLERLLTDARVLSPAGIERAAWGWDRHEDPTAMQRFRDAGHKAERALLGAALGILTRDRLSHEQYVTLVRPMSEALPWLLPEAPPEPRR